MSVLANAHMKSSGGPPLSVPGRANIFGPIGGENPGASTNQSPCQAARVLIHRQGPLPVRSGSYWPGFSRVFGSETVE